MTGGVWAQAVNLFSDLNPNMEVVIICKDKDDIVIPALASKFYSDWFENEKKDIGDTTVTEYLENTLEEAGYVLGEDYKMYADCQWDRTEILV